MRAVADRHSHFLWRADCRIRQRGTPVVRFGRSGKPRARGWWLRPRTVTRYFEGAVSDGAWPVVGEASKHP